MTKAEATEICLKHSISQGLSFIPDLSSLSDKFLINWACKIKKIPLEFPEEENKNKCPSCGHSLGSVCRLDVVTNTSEVVTICPNCKWELKGYYTKTTKEFFINVPKEKIENLEKKVEKLESLVQILCDINNVPTQVHSISQEQWEAAYK